MIQCYRRPAAIAKTRVGRPTACRARITALTGRTEYLRFSDLNHDGHEVLEVLSEDFVLFVPFVVENLIDKTDRNRVKWRDGQTA